MINDEGIKKLINFDAIQGSLGQNFIMIGKRVASLLVA